MNQKIITKKLIDFRNKRKWGKFHTSPGLANAAMIEVAELNELYQWGKNPSDKRVKEEIADIGIFLLYLCEKYKFDFWDIIEEKIEMNKMKYPDDFDYKKEGWKNN